MRDFRKIKTLEDFKMLDSPEPVSNLLIKPINETDIPDEVRILRMLIRPKYGKFWLPWEMKWIEKSVENAFNFDREMTGIKNSWCYVTARRGIADYEKDDEWHFDGASFRTDTIPERNYVWVDKYPIQFRAGRLDFWPSFDPTIHDLNKYAAGKDGVRTQVQYASVGWNLITPFCLHRRDPRSNGKFRTMVRITFTDIEIRDKNNTQNPLVPTESFGRDPVRTYRDTLAEWPNGREVAY